MNFMNSVSEFLRRRWVRLTFFYLALAAFVIPFTFSKIIAPDLFKALYTGRYMGLFLEIPHHSEFTFSPVKPFFPAEAFNWLVNLHLYGLYQLSGYVGLQLFKMFLVFFFLMMAHSLMRFRTNPFSLAILVVMLFGIQQKLLVRNAIMLIPFGILLMWLWQQFRIKRQIEWGIGFFVLFLFWGNMHGTYLVGIGLLGLFVVGDGIDSLYRKNHAGWQWPILGGIILLVSIFIVVFLKPFPDYTVIDVGRRVIQQGGGGMVSSFWYGRDDESTAATSNSAIRRTKRQVDSWRLRLYLKLRHFLQNTVFDTSRPSAGGKSFPLNPTKAYMFTALAILVIVVTLGSFAVTIREFRLSEFLPFIAASIIGLGYVRTVALVPIIVMPILFIKYSRGDFNYLRFGSAANIVSTIVLLALFGLMGYHLVKNDLQRFTNAYLHFGPGKAERYSTKLPQFVRKNYPDERMYNRYVLGTFLVWNWWPEKRVFVDGKSLAYKSDFIRDAYRKNNVKIARKYDLSFMILPIRRSSPYYRSIPHPEWEVVAFDLGMILFQRVSNGDPEDVNGREVMLYTEEEFNALPDSSQAFLSSVAGFIDQYQNDPDDMKKFTSPYQRYDRDIKKLYNQLETR